MDPELHPVTRAHLSEARNALRVLAEADDDGRRLEGLRKFLRAYGRLCVSHANLDSLSASKEFSRTLEMMGAEAADALKRPPPIAGSGPSDLMAPLIGRYEEEVIEATTALQRGDFLDWYWVPDFETGILEIRDEIHCSLTAMNAVGISIPPAFSKQLASLDQALRWVLPRAISEFKKNGQDTRWGPVAKELWWRLGAD